MQQTTRVAGYAQKSILSRRMTIPKSGRYLPHTTKAEVQASATKAMKKYDHMFARLSG